MGEEDEEDGDGEEDDGDLGHGLRHHPPGQEEDDVDRALVAEDPELPPLDGGVGEEEEVEEQQAGEDAEGQDGGEDGGHEGQVGARHDELVAVVSVMFTTYIDTKRLDTRPICQLSLKIVVKTASDLISVTQCRYK